MEIRLMMIIEMGLMVREMMKMDMAMESVMMRDRIEKHCGVGGGA